MANYSKGCGPYSLGSSNKMISRDGQTKLSAPIKQTSLSVNEQGFPNVSNGYRLGAQDGRGAHYFSDDYGTNSGVTFDGNKAYRKSDGAHGTTSTSTNMRTGYNYHDVNWTHRDKVEKVSANPKTASIPLSGGSAQLQPVNMPERSEAPQTKKQQRRNKKADKLEARASKLRNS